MLGRPGREQRDAQIAKGRNECEGQQQPPDKTGRQVAGGGRSKPSVRQIGGCQSEQRADEKWLKFPAERTGDRGETAIWDEAGHRVSNSLRPSSSEHSLAQGCSGVAGFIFP